MFILLNITCKLYVTIYLMRAQDTFFYNNISTKATLKHLDYVQFHFNHARHTSRFRLQRDT